MPSASFYSNVPSASLDPMMIIAQKYAKDENPNKVDLSIGVYKPENGDVKYVFPSVKKAKTEIYNYDEGHPYHSMSGLPQFIRGAQKVVFGDRTKQERIASLQTISGTGAIHMGIEFVKKLDMEHIYVGSPAWSNYKGMIESEGLKVSFFNHYDEKTGTADIDSTLNVIDEIEDGGVLLLQGCCHNPTGADYTKDQWKQIAAKLQDRKIFVFFDIAYQGFASGNKDEDAWAVRYFYDQGFEFLVCQSFSKNMGIYGERAGCLHVVSRETQHINDVQTVMVSVFREQCSFAPLFGARIASYLFEDLKEDWDNDVLNVSNRLKDIRQMVLNKFNELGTPGNWETVVRQHGLFWYSGLNEEQCKKLTDEYHIYIPTNGRFNVAGINKSNVGYVVESINKVVRQ